VDVVHRGRQKGIVVREVLAGTGLALVCILPVTILSEDVGCVINANCDEGWDAAGGDELRQRLVGAHFIVKEAVQASKALLPSRI
jgi:hypothetical protein